MEWHDRIEEAGGKIATAVAELDLIANAFAEIGMADTSFKIRIKAAIIGESLDEINRAAADGLAQTLQEDFRKFRCGGIINLDDRTRDSES